MEIKQEDLVRFWTWCNCDIKPCRYNGALAFSIRPPDNRLLIYGNLIESADLNNLYQYAIPKLQKEGKYIRLNAFADGDFNAMINSNEDDLLLATVFADTPTEALYNAIMEVIDNETH